MHTEKFEISATPTDGNRAPTRSAWQAVKAHCSELVSPETGAALALCCGYSLTTEPQPASVAGNFPQ